MNKAAQAIASFLLSIAGLALAVLSWGLLPTIMLFAYFFAIIGFIFGIIAMIQVSDLFTESLSVIGVVLCIVTFLFPFLF